MLRAILFDFNGVIIDDEPIHLRLFQQVLAEEGIALAEVDYYDRYLGYDDRDCFREVLKNHGRDVPESLVSDLITRKATVYDRTIRKEMILFPGAERLIASASERCSLAVVSGALRHEIELVLKKAGLRNRFRAIISAEDVQEGKPSPEGYQKAVVALRERPDAADLRPEECLAIEDSVAGIVSAHGAGMRCLAVAHSYPEPTLRSADWTMGSINDVNLDTLFSFFGNSTGSSGV